MSTCRFCRCRFFDPRIRILHRRLVHAGCLRLVQVRVEPGHRRTGNGHDMRRGNELFGAQVNTIRTLL